MSIIATRPKWQAELWVNDAWRVQLFDADAARLRSTLDGLADLMRSHGCTVTTGDDCWQWTSGPRLTAWRLVPCEVTP